MADEPNDLVEAIAELDEGYLRAQLFLAVRRASSDEPRRAALWHSVARLLAADQQRRQGAGGGGGESPEDELARASVMADVREELRLDAEALDLETFEADGS